MILELAVALVLILAWILAVIILHRSGWLERHNLAPLGPFLMWKTKRGREFVDRISRYKRFWAVMGDFGIALTVVAMVAMTVLLLWVATRAASIPAERAPTPEMILGIPGLNPLIPLWYGIAALAIAIIVHEFSHGIMSRLANVKIVSMGLLMFIFPIGAFVEPDEEDVQALSKRGRARLYASGSASNLILALVFAVIFSVIFMGAVTPVALGNGVVQVIDGTPASTLDLERGDIITSFNNTTLTSRLAFQAAIANTLPNATVPMTVFDGQTEREMSVNLTWRSDRSSGYLGVMTIYTGTEVYHPIGGAESLGGYFNSFIIYVSLPLARLSPVDEPLTNFYQVGGAFAGVPTGLFWVMANLAYWLFWINLMLGLTNALPAVPLDGGYIFRDGVDSLVSRLRRRLTAAERERYVRSVSYAFALLILSLVLWQLIAPRL
jgi:membrane-associated protease RseP (regulator of RpoE activity)